MDATTIATGSARERVSARCSSTDRRQHIASIATNCDGNSSEALIDAGTMSSGADECRLKGGHPPAG